MRISDVNSVSLYVVQKLDKDGNGDGYLKSFDESLTMKFFTYKFHDAKAFTASELDNFLQKLAIKRFPERINLENLSIIELSKTAKCTRVNDFELKTEK